MHNTVLQAKIHRATVTDASLHYEGSLTIDSDLLKLAGLVEYQQIQVYNITSGHRFETYTIVGESGSGVIQVNGAAAHLAQKGDLIIIAAYGQIPLEDGPVHEPKLVYVDKSNKPAPKPALLPV
jgi:aspartate 1-decarboxylase